MTTRFAGVSGLLAVLAARRLRTSGGGYGLLFGAIADVPDLDRVERRPYASHWVHHDESERVNQLLIDFSPPPNQTSREPLNADALTTRPG